MKTTEINVNQPDFKEACFWVPSTLCTIQLAILNPSYIKAVEEKKNRNH
ncbi:hypothetical protein VP01_11420g1 [Puccinia sorghi]|uniref:Uncharacterized protein n=1 Tax=Puccinia sorghi TaxID=27349 RepID=A0A0L6VS51_9BASI|nr:hypothetical protein VP01_11420g1 [Puccinia sorghi]